MSNIFWNTGSKPIFITLDYEPGPLGRPRIVTKQICIEPGQGIDLDITPLKRKEDTSKISDLKLDRRNTEGET